MIRTINNKTGGALWIVAFALVFSAWWSISLAQTDATPAEPSSETAATEAPAAVEDEEALAAEDAEVEQVLKDAELIYKDDDDGDFIPSQAVSADQSIDYPIDI
ncbi:MAG: hypothetical protein AAF004_11200 [Pseudomonadota bacterium]